MEDASPPAAAQQGVRPLLRRRVRLWAAFLAAAALLATSALWVDRGVDRILHDIGQMAEAQGNLELIHATYALLKDAESAQRGLLLTGDERFDIAYFQAVPELTAEIERLGQRLREDPEQTERLAQLTDLVAQRLDTSTSVVRRFRNDGFEAAREEVAKGTGANLMEEISALIDAIEQAERQRLQGLGRDRDQARMLLRLVGLGGIALSALILLLLFRAILREVAARGEAERAATGARESLARTVAELTTATGETRQLSEYAGLLQSCHSVEEALGITWQVFRRLLPGYGGSVYLLRASADQLRQVGGWGTHAAGSSAEMLPADCWALRRGQPHGVDDLGRGAACPHVEARPGQSAATLCVPVVARGETMGLVYLSSADPIPASRSALVGALVEQLSLALANLRLQDSLRTQSIRDPLTGLFNRRYLEESMARELARCERRGQPLAVLLLDLDHFKRFNDSHGHDAGDTVLQHFARVLESGCRPEDIPCRLGGEEFTLVLPETNREAALARAQEIRTRVAAMRVTHLRTTLGPVTVSIGVAMFPLDATTAADLLHVADAALYRAKREGRDRVVAA